ncbi:MAG: DUF1801 domain-containing protein [Chitinophagales bacterium]
MATKPITVTDYLKAVPADQRKALEQLRKTIKAVAPNAEELISYGIPAYKYEGRLLVGFAAFKGHCSFFLCSGSFLNNYKDEVTKFGGTKSCLHFTSEKPLPTALIKKMVKERMKENELKAASKKKVAKKVSLKK